jgi:hypothetical protein
VKVGFYKLGRRTDKHTQTFLVLDRQPILVEENKGSSFQPRMVKVREWRVLLSQIGKPTGFGYHTPTRTDGVHELDLPHNPDEDGWFYRERSFVIHPPDGEPYDLPPEGSEP